MALAIAHSRGLDGLQAPPVLVETHLASGLPSFTLVGLPDTEVKEARDRVRAAIVNSGFEFPQIDALPFHRAPQAFNEDVVHPSAFAIHGDGDAGILKP